MTDSEFNLSPGRIISRKFEVISKLGCGWEGEVYKILETGTNIERAAKLFYPERNKNDKTANFYAKQLHKLRECPILIQYHTKETFIFKRKPITVLISEFIEGELLSEFITRFPGKRLSSFQALHLLYAMTKGVEQIHNLGEYHGDLHTENVIINKFGLEFQLKLLDLIFSKESKRESRREDIVDLIKIFYDSFGGAKHYSRQPDAIKYICCGLKPSLILKKFKNVTQLRIHLENMHW
tara:strand:+ start:2240 stop:2953 length:714 start_codon:yes stop_codon:yes gene_type:complete